MEDKDETSGSKRMENSSITSASKRGITTSSEGDVSTKEDRRESIDTVFDCVISYIHDASDRNSFSLVCRKWYELDSLTRKHVTVHMYYVTKPSRLLQRSPFLESLTLKGGPAVWFPDKFMVYVTPWIQQIVVSFNCLKSLHLRSVLVFDSDLEILARTRGKQLRVLKIARCYGFYADGLLHIARYCNNLQTLYLEINEFLETDGEWLHELALHSTCIESLDFYNTYLKFDIKDLVLLAKNCSQSLVSLKLPKCDLVDLGDFFRFAVMLEEFSCAKFGNEKEKHAGFQFPPNLRRIGLGFMTKTELPIILPFAHHLIELDLRCALLNEDNDSFFVLKCPNLEVLYAKIYSDNNLRVIGQFCKKLRKLKIEIGSELYGFPSNKGLIALEQGCPELLWD